MTVTFLVNLYSQCIVNAKRIIKLDKLFLWFLLPNFAAWIKYKNTSQN
jgi:hypothetical protein